jgi:hypothetical protein
MSALNVQVAVSPAMREGLPRDPPWRESHLLRLPGELLVDVLARLLLEGDVTASRTCKLFNSFHPQALHQFCKTRWPARYDVLLAAAPGGIELAQLTSLIRFLRLQQDESSSMINVVDVIQKQNLMIPAHRGIVIGWLIEVSPPRALWPFNAHLTSLTPQPNSQVVWALGVSRETSFKATRFFDRHLAHVQLLEVMQYASSPVQ